MLVFLPSSFSEEDIFKQQTVHHGRYHPLHLTTRAMSHDSLESTDLGSNVEPKRKLLFLHGEGLTGR